MRQDKTIDEFFNNPDNLSWSKCDKASWKLVYQASRIVYTHNLPPSSIDDDLTRVEQIDECAEKADEERNNSMQILIRLLRDNRKEIAEAYANDRVFTPMDSNDIEVSQYLERYVTQQIVYEYAHNASQMYMN